MHQVFTEADQKSQCPYCRSDLKDVVWHSHFESTRMYKGFNCGCGNFISIAVDFLGSGHDNWDNKNSWKNHPNVRMPKIKEKIKTLESKLRIVKEYKMHP